MKRVDIFYIPICMVMVFIWSCDGHGICNYNLEKNLAIAYQNNADAMSGEENTSNDNNVLNTAFYIHPYLQSVTKDSIIIRWETDNPSKDVVNYGKTREYGSSFSEISLVKEHEVMLTELGPPGAQYYYSVVSGSETVEGKFKLAPSETQPFRFVVWGDSQYNPNVYCNVSDAMLEQEPDVAFSVGDVVIYGYPISYKEEFFDVSKNFLLETPFFIAIGNHEYSPYDNFPNDNVLENFKRLFTQPGNELYFAITYGNARFIVLDSQYFTDEEYAWFQNELKSEEYSNAKWHFLFLHHAPYSWTWYGGEERIRELVVPLAEEYKIDIFFAGHFHNYERGETVQDGHKLIYIVTGGGGCFFTTPDKYPPGYNVYDHMKIQKWVHHFMLIEVDGDNLNGSAIEKYGETIDSFDLTK